MGSQSRELVRIEKHQGQILLKTAKAAVIEERRLPIAVKNLRVSARFEVHDVFHESPRE
jgi:hypothetical protein